MVENTGKIGVFMKRCASLYHGRQSHQRGLGSRWGERGSWGRLDGRGNAIVTNLPIFTTPGDVK